jgi:hypothetical protein
MRAGVRPVVKIGPDARQLGSRGALILLRDTGHRHATRTRLSEIYNWFTEGFDTADLKEAKALLDELSGSP